MAIPVTGDFTLQANALGSEPIFTVELLAANRFLATLEPAFVGNWLAGDGLIAGSGILAGDPYPTYTTDLKQIIDAGIGDISMGLDSAGLARTGNSSVGILNQTQFSDFIATNGLTNSIIRIRLGFKGQTFQDYVTIFQGVVDDWQATLQDFDLELIDETLVTLTPVPPQTGSDFLPTAATQGRAIPIILGDIELVPAFNIITTTSALVLAPFEVNAEELIVRDVGASFPSSGTLLLTRSNPPGTETVSYTGVTTTVSGQQPGFQFNNVVRPGTQLVFPPGSTADLTSFSHSYLLGFRAERVRKIRRALGVHPTGTQTTKTLAIDPINGLDARQIHVIESDTAFDDLTATVAGEGRGPNLIINGEGNVSPVTAGWSIVNGTWSSVTPAGESEPLLQGRVLVSQVVPSELRQDVTTVLGRRYRLVFSMRLDAAAPPPFATVQVGNTVSPVSVYDFGTPDNTFEQGFDLTFLADSTTTRITLYVQDNGGVGGPFDAYFDHLELYDLTTENPAVQITNLITGHMPTIKVDAASFSEAETLFNNFGDRLAGAVDQSQEGQTLLGRIAAQFRSKTWLNEDGRQKIKIFNNSEPPIRNIGPSIVDKGTFTYKMEPLDKVYDRFYVYFDRRPDVSGGSLGGRESYQGVLFATPEETNSIEDGALKNLCQNARSQLRVSRPLEIFADMIPGAATADRLLSHTVRLNTARRVSAQWTSYLNLVDLEVADVVRIAHPLLPGFANNVTYEIIEKEIHPNGCMVSFTALEIRQSQFNSFIETWDLVGFPIPSVVNIETWEVTGSTRLAVFDSNGNPFRCNPFIEVWETSVLSRHERFTAWKSTNNLGLAPVALTASLIGQYEQAGDFTSFFPDHALTEKTSDYSLFNTLLALQATVPAIFRNASTFGLEPTLDPGFGVASGPSASFGAWNFSNNGGTRQYMTGEPHVHWDQTDCTVNFWFRMTAKGTVIHRPIMMQRNHITEDDELLDDNVPYMVYWDKGTDRIVLSFNHFEANGRVNSPGRDAFIAGLTNKITASTLGAPVIGTWYMATVRWDLSTLTADLDINGVNQGSVVVGSAPDSGAGKADDNGQGGAIFGSDVRHVFTGGDNNSMGLTGQLAGMGFWSRRLLDAELTELYNSGSGLVFPFV